MFFVLSLYQMKNFLLVLFKKVRKSFFYSEKRCTFAPQISIGLWCNGNTADSGPAFPGSSPGSPTESFSYTEALFVIKIKP